jgi:hypothetical protein
MLLITQTLLPSRTYKLTEIPRECRVITYKRALREEANEEFYLPGYSAVYFVESQPMFRRNMSTPSAELNSKPSMEPANKAKKASIPTEGAGVSSEMFLLRDFGLSLR